MSAEEEKHDVVEGGEAEGVVAPVSEEESLGRLSDEAVAGMSEVDLLAAVEAGRLTGIPIYYDRTKTKLTHCHEGRL